MTALRNLLHHGLGGHPFLGEFRHARGRWVLACLHSEFGYTYLRGASLTRLERLQ